MTSIVVTLCYIRTLHRRFDFNLYARTRLYISCVCTHTYVQWQNNNIIRLFYTVHAFFGCKKFLLAANFNCIHVCWLVVLTLIVFMIA